MLGPHHSGPDRVDYRCRHGPSTNPKIHSSNSATARSEGVRILIGGESQVIPFEDLSIVSAPYEVDGQVVGTLGVIGPIGRKMQG